MNTHTEEYKGYTILIALDDDPQNPREFDNLGLMVCAHPKYILGDYMLGKGWNEKSRHDPVPFVSNPQAFQSWIKANTYHGRIVALPLYLFDHGGISLQARPFGDPWDSGMVGYIYVTRERIQKEYGWKNLTTKRIQFILATLQAEVMLYNDYLIGNVYGWIVQDEAGETIESVWGYYGQVGKDYAISEAKNCIDYTIRQEIKTNGQQLILPGLEEHLQEEVQLERQKLDTAVDAGR